MAKLAVNWIGPEDFPVEFEVNETSFDCDVCRPDVPQLFAAQFIGTTATGFATRHRCAPMEVRAFRHPVEEHPMHSGGYKLF